MNENVIAVNVLEAARRLGVSPRTIAALIAQNKLPSRKIGRSAMGRTSAKEHLFGKLGGSK
jgi:hypothetical protein